MKLLAAAHTNVIAWAHEMVLAAPPELLLGPCKTISSTLLHCDSGPTCNIQHFQSMGLLKSSDYFHVFSTYGPTWAFPTSLIKLQDGFTNYYNKHLHHYVKDDVLNHQYEQHSWSTFRKIHHAGVLNNPTNIVSKEPQSRTTFKRGCKWERTQVMRRDSEAAISSHQ